MPKSIRGRNAWQVAGRGGVSRFPGGHHDHRDRSTGLRGRHLRTTASVNVRTGPRNRRRQHRYRAQVELSSRWIANGRAEPASTATQPGTTLPSPTASTGAITDYYTTTPSWNSYAPSTGSCGSTQGVVVHNLGGVDMQGACDTQYPRRGLTAVATNVNSAYSWRCRPGCLSSEST